MAGRHCRCAEGHLACEWPCPRPAVGTCSINWPNCRKALQERDALQLRIDKMEADRANFLVEVTAVATEAKRAGEG